MSFERQLSNRRHREEESSQGPEPFDASAALRAARMARASASSKPWVESFFKKAENSQLSLPVLSDIVAQSDSLDAALGVMTQKLAAGLGNKALAQTAQADAARRICAAHAKAHAPKRSRNGN